MVYFLFYLRAAHCIVDALVRPLHSGIVVVTNKGPSSGVSRMILILQDPVHCTASLSSQPTRSHFSKIYLSQLKAVHAFHALLPDSRPLLSVVEACTSGEA